ncbi:hypothetical protein R1sor_012887 [Riccia sorocarpa]|uniref:NADP-dependent oxidoreductase domain-containing protein n=1 Tax=Riccia sorocarpa TaxID=122646 RepID=A0ABD3I5N1_9MARC
MAIVPTVPLRSQGLELSAQSLVGMGMSAFDSPPKADEVMIELIHKAVKHGVTLLDTSDVYGLTQMRSLEEKQKVQYHLAERAFSDEKGEEDLLFGPATDKLSHL